MEKKEKRKVRKNEGQGPYILRYPLLDGKAEYYYFDKKKKITGSVFFSISLNGIFFFSLHPKLLLNPAHIWTTI